MAAPQGRRLYVGADLPDLLHLTQEQIDWLVETRQLQPFQICGESRYDSRQIDDLINTYRQTASRRYASEERTCLSWRRCDGLEFMSGESGVVVGRRGRAEMERLAGLYRAGGMGRGEFCRSHGMGLSTLTRYLKKQQQRPSPAGSSGVEPRRLVAVEVAPAVAAVCSAEGPGTLTVVLSGRRRVEVGRGFDAATLAQLVTVLERL